VIYAAFSNAKSAVRICHGAQEVRGTMLRRLPATLMGGLLAFAAWEWLHIRDFPSRMLVALVAFGIAHGINYLIQGPPPEAREGPTAGPPPTRIAGKGVILVILIVGAVGFIAALQRSGAGDSAKGDAGATDAPLISLPTKVSAGASGVEIEGPITDAVMNEVRAKGFTGATVLTWTNATQEQLDTAHRLGKDVRILVIRCAHAGASLGAFGHLENLETLSLFCEKISGLPVLSTHKSLTRLKFTSTLFRIDFIADDAPNLEALDLDVPFDSQQSLDIGAIGKLSKLKRLNLSGRPVTDLSPLRSLKSLEVLEINRIPATDLSPLLDVPLKQLSVTGTKITDAQIAALYAAHADLKITR
jgi:hypothetical protein